jgi:hypothetical protein
MKLEAKIKRSVERELGRAIPSPNTEQYGPFLAELRVTHPELAERLGGAVILDTPSDPQSIIERRAQAAEVWLKLKRSLFYRFDELTSVWYLSRTKLTLWGLVPVLALVGSMYSQNFVRVSRAVQAQVQTGAQTVSTELGFGSSFATNVPVEAPPEMPLRMSETPEISAQAGTPQKTTSTVQQAAPSPLTAKQFATTEMPPPPAQHPVDVFTRNEPEVVKAYERQTSPVQSPDDAFASQAGAKARGLSVYQRESGQPLGGVMAAAEPTTTMAVYESESRNSLTVYDGSAVSADLPSGASPTSEADTSANSDPFASEITPPASTPGSASGDTARHANFSTRFFVYG